MFCNCCVWNSLFGLVVWIFGLNIVLVYIKVGVVIIFVDFVVVGFVEIIDILIVVLVVVVVL